MRDSVDPADQPPARTAFLSALKSRRGVAALLLLVGIGAVAAALVSGGMSAQARRADGQILSAHALEVMSVARDLLSQAQDLEIGQRGYLLARDPEYLEPYLRAQAGLDAQVSKFRTLTGDNPRQQASIAELDRLLGELRSKLRLGVELGQAGQFDTAVADLILGGDKRLMDDVRVLLGQMLAEEERLIAERREQSRQSAVALAWYLAGLALLGVGLIMFAVISVFTAVSERTRADLEAARAASAMRAAAGERRFRTITEAMPQIVWSATREGRFDFVNAKWQEYTGAPGTEQTWIDHIHPDDRPKVAASWMHSLATGDTYEREVRLRAADGGYRWFLCRAVPLRDASGRIESWLGAGTDVHEARLNLEARELISQELSHRIKNIFSVISALVTLSTRANPEQAQFAADLRSRIQALARAHEFVRPHSPASAARTGPRTYGVFVKELLSAYCAEDPDRIRVTGEDFTFGDKSATALALFFHELGTNSAKYGALSEAAGHVVIDVAREDERIAITWTERGGPRVTEPPTREGFGATLAKLSIEGQLDGSLSRTWAPEGLVVVARISNKAVAQA